MKYYDVPRYIYVIHISVFILFLCASRDKVLVEIKHETWMRYPNWCRLGKVHLEQRVLEKSCGWRKHYHNSHIVCGLCPLISPRLDWFQISTCSCSKRLCSSATAKNISCAFAWSQDNKPILWKSSMKDFLIAVSGRGETHERKIEPAFTMWQDHWPQGYLQLGCWNFSGGGGNSNIFGNVHPENLGVLWSNLTYAYFFKWVETTTT